MEQCILAAGDFHAAQYYFDQIPGVTGTTAGYAGGSIEDPTYEDVVSGTTGHIEAVLVQFDAGIVSFEVLCRRFFEIQDAGMSPSAGLEGAGYRGSAIFYISDQQRQTAERVLENIAGERNLRPVVAIERAGPFYRAEEHHQKYLEKNGIGTGMELNWSL